MGSKGSPPHTRGKLLFYVTVGYVYRLTPAHAGKTAKRRKREAYGNGSPPHTRGKQNQNIRLMR